MPLPMYLNVPSATQSFRTDMKAGCDIAAAQGYTGVRFSAGLSGYGNNSTVDTTYVKECVAYAVSKGLKCSILLNLGPNYKGTYIKSLNGQNPLPVPTLPTNTAVLDWVAQGWQDFADGALLVTTAANLEWEWSNEPGIGGNQDPVDKDPTTGVETHTTYPIATYPSGTIVPAFFTSLEYVSSRVNFRGCNTICFTLEGESTTVAQREVDSVTGADATSCIARATYIGTNRYSDIVDAPYDSAATKAAFSAKLAEQLVRMAASPRIGAKQVKLREFGLDKRRCPRCQVPNQVRDDLLTQVLLETGIVDASFFCLFDTSNGANQADGSPYWFASNDLITRAAFDGVTVAP